MWRKGQIASSGMRRIWEVLRRGKVQKKVQKKIQKRMQKEIQKEIQKKRNQFPIKM